MIDKGSAGNVPHVISPQLVRVADAEAIAFLFNSKCLNMCNLEVSNVLRQHFISCTIFYSSSIFYKKESLTFKYYHNIMSNKIFRTNNNINTVEIITRG